MMSLPGSWKHQPGKFELGQLNIQVVYEGWQVAFVNGQEREAVSHRDQTQVHHQSIVGARRLRDDDQRSLQIDVQGQTEALLSKVSNTGRCLLSRLSRRCAQSFFGRLEVVGEVLKEKKSRNDSDGRKSALLPRQRRQKVKNRTSW